ncbi:response regulator [Arenicella xantha]|uniref:Two-component system response regulator GlrR n=1 Tax=Arenicella xantha TaxID=644221 RepID=A0A395JSW2_9GAMM|nr:response regulator [Arenicella xantha]RBP52648.1 two-component system response regulator GlrR [Arenicella xantha]
MPIAKKHRNNELQRTHHAKVLLVDDNADLLKLISLRLKPLKFELKTATSAEEAISILALWRADLVVTDLQMGGISGMELFEHIHSRHPVLPVIILTAHGTIPDAVAATQSGVASYLTKPFDSDTLVRQIQSSLLASGYVADTVTRSECNSWRQHIVTKNPAMETLLSHVAELANSDDVVLFEGEHGTGKEELARALHARSDRADKPLISISFDSAPEEDLEAEMFGRVGGQSEQQQEKLGALMRADGGAILMTDFVGVSAKFLKRLLVAWHAQQATPVNSDQAYKFDVRVLCTTTRIGKFGQNQESLWQMGPKLEFTTLAVPSLDERREDIPLIASHCLNNLKGKSDYQFSNKAIQLLLNADWPGNIRQLINVVKQCANLSNTKIISDTLVKTRIDYNEDSLPPLSNAHRDFEREYLVEVLKRTNGNVTRAADLAQRNRTEFHRLLNKHKIEAKSFRQNP